MEFCPYSIVSSTRRGAGYYRWLEFTLLWLRHSWPDTGRLCHSFFLCTILARPRLRASRKFHLRREICFRFAVLASIVWIDGTHLVWMSAHHFRRRHSRTTLWLELRARHCQREYFRHRPHPILLPRMGSVPICSFRFWQKDHTKWKQIKRNALGIAYVIVETRLFGDDVAFGAEISDLGESPLFWCADDALLFTLIAVLFTLLRLFWVDKYS